MYGKGSVDSVNHMEVAKQCGHLLVVAVALVGLDDEEDGCLWISKFCDCCSNGVGQVRCHIIFG